MLSRETIQEICDLVKNGRKMDAVRYLRISYPVGLREAREFIDKQTYGHKHGDDPRDLYNALIGLADLKRGTVFENHFLRIEVKDTQASFLPMQSFLMDVLAELYPQISYADKQEAVSRMLQKFSDWQVETV